MNLDLYKKTYDIICKAITKEGAKILEIGCGPGNITKYLLSKRPDYNVYGIDVALAMVHLARKNNPTGFFEVMDARHIHRLETCFDGVICGFCLPYLSPVDANKLILDTGKLLNHNGLIYLSFVEGDPDASHFQSGSSGNRCYFYYHKLEELRIKLGEVGFMEIEVSKVEYKKSNEEMEFHTILIAKKYGG